jgi:hypothetical protein
MAIAFIIITVVIVLVLAVMLWRQGHPEQTATDHEDFVGDTPSERLYGRQAVDAAGPDAEATGVAGPGEPSIDPDTADERRHDPT